MKRWLIMVISGPLSMPSAWSASEAGAPAWPPFPTPSGASVSWVAENIRYNQVPMQIRMMHTGESPARVLAFYRERWKDAGGKLGETQLSPWRILSRSSGAFLFTVETRAVPKTGHDFPMMAGSKVQMDMESFDEGKQGRMIMHRNSFPVEDNALYLREQLLLYGWARHKDNRSPDGRSRTMVFSRGHQELVVTLSRNGSQTEILSSQTDVE